MADSMIDVEVADSCPAQVDNFIPETNRNVPKIRAKMPREMEQSPPLCWPGEFSP
jgi:hypothetical protein